MSEFSTNARAARAARATAAPARALAVLTLVMATLFAPSCADAGRDDPEQQKQYTLKYVNQFAYNVMAVYYLWVDEISKGLQSWKNDDDPILKVQEVRYKDADGNDIDRWTKVTDDYDSFVKSVDGVSTTFGYEFSLFYTSEAKDYVAAVVTFVYDNTPADIAGLKRGDIIVKVDGSAIPTANYYDIVTGKLINASHCDIGLNDGTEVSMDAVQMYCDPVHTWKVFDCGDKKVGYLHYSAFTRDSCQDLVDVFAWFKQQGVSEMILDLRYNGGGYVTTEEVLASMLAPEANVAAGDVFMTEVNNYILTEAWGSEPTYFSTHFNIDKKPVITTDSHLDLTKIYAIMTGGSASASEALICGLKPYIDIEIIGQKSYGKYCTGLIYPASKWYSDVKDKLSSAEYCNGVKYSDNWGIYVMIGRYADRDGNTPCMPDGFTPDHVVADAPLDGHQLGDPEETMLKAALTLAGYPYPDVQPASAPSKTKPILEEEGPALPESETFGVFYTEII